MARMFQEASSFNCCLSQWDVSNVIDTNSMFLSASVFNGNISQWTTTSLTNCNTMFANATTFNQDLSGWYSLSHTLSLYIFIYNKFKKKPIRAIRVIL